MVILHEIYVNWLKFWQPRQFLRMSCLTAKFLSLEPLIGNGNSYTLWPERRGIEIWLHGWFLSCLVLFSEMVFTFVHLLLFSGFHYLFIFMMHVYLAYYVAFLQFFLPLFVLYSFQILVVHVSLIYHVAFLQFFLPLFVLSSFQTVVLQ